ncbi:MAG TPA: hypothetical protein VMM81_07000 [Acidimicrobiia bacterium]|nr:hypothetical protein [Acidimicrobiia bacterium]
MLGVGILTIALGSGLGLMFTDPPTGTPGTVIGPPPPIVQAQPPPVGSKMIDLIPAILAAASTLLASAGLLGTGGQRRSVADMVRFSGEVSPGDALRLSSPPGLQVVFVPGHGDAHASRVFHEMVAMLGLDPASVHHFDYRWVVPVDDHAWAARLAPADLTALTLNDFLAEVSARGESIYVVAFSKGGASMAELVARWDRGLEGPNDAVIGAALLDPPIAHGLSGWLQSAGRVISDIPNDGGYDPIECLVMRFECVDTRVDLGMPSGVEVVVIQNPKAGVTNLGTARPDGLRVVDVADDGPGPLAALLGMGIFAPVRIARAHRSVRRSPTAAACINAEMWSPGACSLSSASASHRRGPLDRAHLQLP